MGRDIEIVPDFLSKKHFWSHFLEGKQKCNQGTDVNSQGNMPQ